MYLEERLLPGSRENTEKLKFTGSRVATVPSLTACPKNFKCGCHTVISYTKFPMGLKKSVSDDFIKREGNIDNLLPFFYLSPS